MASTITAGNATNGLALSCDNTGILELKTGTGAGTTAVTIDASQSITIPNAVTLTGGVAGNFLMNSGYGSVATAFGCRAWVNFNGTGTVAIRASGNVTSITDINTGDYRINFTNAMPDSNYSCASTIGNSGTGGGIMVNGGANGAGQVFLYTYNSSSTLTDYAQVQLAILR